MLLTNFVLLSFALLALCALIFTRLPLATRQRLLIQGMPGYAYHGATDKLAIKGSEALPDSISLRSLEMLHGPQRARLILRYTAPTELCTPDALSSWSETLMRGVLEATGAHVVVLEIMERDTHTFVAQRLMTSDGLGWTGDRFDQVRQTTHLVVHGATAQPTTPLI